MRPIPHLSAMFILVSSAAVPVPGADVPSTAKVQANDPRPLKAALDTIEAVLGVPINYEDPRFSYAGDVVDITDQVQNARQRAANPTKRILVPRGGVLNLEASLLTKKAGIADALALATQLRALHESTGFPGRFAVRQVGSMATVEPISTRGQSGSWTASGAVMGTAIRIQSERVSAAEALSIIADALSLRLGVKVGVGRFPYAAFANLSVTLSAADEPAGEVLVRVLEQLSSFGVQNLGQPAYSYRMLFDPGVKYYLLHINAVVPVRSETAVPSGPAPLPEGFLRSTLPKSK